MFICFRDSPPDPCKKLGLPDDLFNRVTASILFANLLLVHNTISNLLLCLARCGLASPRSAVSCSTLARDIDSQAS